MEPLNEHSHQTWLAVPASLGRIYFIQILTKNDLEHQETLFKRLLYSYLTSTLDNMRNAESSEGKNSATRRLFETTIKGSMNEWIIPAAEVLNSPKSIRDPAEPLCWVPELGTAPAAFHPPPASTSAPPIFAFLHSFYTMVSSLWYTSCILYLLDTKPECLLSKSTGWNLHVHKKVTWRALPAFLSQHCPFSSPSKTLLVKIRCSSAQIKIMGPASFSPTCF